MIHHLRFSHVPSWPSGLAFTQGQFAIERYVTKKNAALFVAHAAHRSGFEHACAEELELLQGNILKSHGREAALYAFLTFDEGKRDEAKEFIHEFADRVTSVRGQFDQSRRFQKRGRRRMSRNSWQAFV